MDETPQPPVEGMSGAEATDILGVATELYVSRLVGQGVIAKAVKNAQYGLERADVERVALDRWKPGPRTSPTRSKPPTCSR